MPSRMWLLAPLLVLVACGPAAPPADPAAPPGAAKLPAAGAEPFHLMHHEGFGPLRIGQSEREISALLGPPEEKGAAELWGADGLHHQAWRYPRRGITLDLVSETADGRSEVASITVSAPSGLRTWRGIGIGDPEAQARKLYKDVADTETPVEDDTFIAGSAYGGLVFTFRDGKVSGMFLGAAAE